MKQVVISACEEANSDSSVLLSKNVLCDLLEFMRLMLGTRYLYTPVLKMKLVFE